MPVISIHIQITVIAIAAVLCVAAAFKDRGKIFTVLKPATTILIIVLAAQSDQTLFRNLLLAGLIFSLIGDTLLLKRENRRYFKIGLVSFLITHLLYSCAFSMGAPLQMAEPGILMVLLLLGLLLYRRFRPSLGTMTGPVLIYIVVISIMVERAAATFGNGAFTTPQAFRLFAGAVLFYISDVILAWNRFVKPFPYNRINLLFYYAGQTLIVTSLF